MREAFVFGIPLIARSVCGDWPMVEHLLGLTLRSILAQGDADFRVILAAHDVPGPWEAVARDPRFVLLRADWRAAPPTAANDDGGRKKWLIKQRVRADGGGLLMFLDADDWIGRDLVRSARAGIGPRDVGAILTSGLALDHASLRIARFPIGDAFDGPFHGLCGSSTIGRVVADSTDPVRLDPHLVLGSHHEWEGRAAHDGLPLARIEEEGVYMIGTGQNHSEHQGPFAQWRRDVTEAVRRTGKPLSENRASGFGQVLAKVRRT